MNHLLTISEVALGVIVAEAFLFGLRYFLHFLSKRSAHHALVSRINSYRLTEEDRQVERAAGLFVGYPGSDRN
jgi:hypothetical protein